MPWLFSERRGPAWKQGWVDQTLSSLSLPPSPFIAIFAIVIIFLFLSRYMDYKTQMQHTMISFQVFLFLVPILLIFIMRSLSVNGRLPFRLPRNEPDSIHRAGSSPWGVALVLVVLLLMISYQSSFHSQWFRPLWRQ